MISYLVYGHEVLYAMKESRQCLSCCRQLLVVVLFQYRELTEEMYYEHKAGKLCGTSIYLHDQIVRGICSLIRPVDTQERIV